MLYSMKHAEYLELNASAFIYSSTIYIGQVATFASNYTLYIIINLFSFCR